MEPKSFCLKMRAISAFPNWWTAAPAIGGKQAVRRKSGNDARDRASIHAVSDADALTVGSSASGVSTIPFRIQELQPEQQYRIAGPLVLGAGGYVGIWSPEMTSTQASTE
jgi:hypothetical protein